ncbi:hypothetical protein SALBM311S_09975 [Streptomyces alboniger]
MEFLFGRRLAEPDSRTAIAAYMRHYPDHIDLDDFPTKS